MELRQRPVQAAQALRRQLRLDQLRQRHHQGRLPRSDRQEQAAEAGEVKKMAAGRQPFLQDAAAGPPHAGLCTISQYTTSSAPNAGTPNAVQTLSYVQ